MKMFDSAKKHRGELIFNKHRTNPHIPEDIREFIGELINRHWIFTEKEEQIPEDIKHALLLTDKIMETDVMPQAKNMVFQDFSELNELMILLTKLKDYYSA